MKFEIKKQISVKTDAELKIRGDSLVFTIGKWNVFKLNSNGIGHVYGGIPKNNQEGLQVDEKGRLVLSND